MGMGILLMGMGIAYFIGEKIKFPSIFIGLSITQNVAHLS